MRHWTIFEMDSVHLLESFFPYCGSSSMFLLMRLLVANRPFLRGVLEVWYEVDITDFPPARAGCRKCDDATHWHVCDDPQFP